MKKSSGSRSRKQRLTAVWTRCADHVTPPYPQKLALTSPTGGGRSVGIVRVRTKATEFVLFVLLQLIISLHDIFYSSACSHLLLFSSSCFIYFSNRSTHFVILRFRIVAMSVIVHLKPQKICTHYMVYLCV